MIDLGAGIGNIIVVAAIVFPIARSIGIEYFPHYHSIYQSIINKLKFNDQNYGCTISHAAKLNVAIASSALSYYYDHSSTLSNSIINKMEYYIADVLDMKYRIDLLQATHIFSFNKTWPLDTIITSLLKIFTNNINYVSKTSHYTGPIIHSSSESQSHARVIVWCIRPITIIKLYSAFYTRFRYFSKFKVHISKSKQYCTMYAYVLHHQYHNSPTTTTTTKYY